MAEELKEDKLIIKKDNTKKGARDGWELIKIIWLFQKKNYSIHWIQLENSTQE